MKLNGKDFGLFCKIAVKRISKGSDFKILFSWIQHAPSYHPTNKQISRETGIHISHISRGYKSLCKLKLLKKCRDGSNLEYDARSPVYVFHPDVIDEIKLMKCESEQKTLLRKQVNGDTLIAEKNEKLDFLKELENYIDMLELKNRESRESYNTEGVFFLIANSLKRFVPTSNQLNEAGLRLVSLYCHKSKSLSDSRYEAWQKDILDKWNIAVKYCSLESDLDSFYRKNEENINWITSKIPNEMLTSAAQDSGVSVDKMVELLDEKIQNDQNNSKDVVWFFLHKQIDEFLIVNQQDRQ